MCVSVCLILIVCYIIYLFFVVMLFVWIVKWMNVCVEVCYICLYFYHVIIIFYYKVGDSRKKIVKLVIVQTFDWLSRHFVYYLYMNEYNFVGQ